MSDLYSSINEFVSPFSEATQVVLVKIGDCTIYVPVSMENPIKARNVIAKAAARQRADLCASECEEPEFIK